jgi:hypothetical protein
MNFFTLLSLVCLLNVGSLVFAIRDLGETDVADPLGEFSILSKTGITNTDNADNPTLITGNIGISPIGGTGYKGLKCSAVTGEEFVFHAVNAGVQTPMDASCMVIAEDKLTRAVLAMQAAYTAINALTDPVWNRVNQQYDDDVTFMPGVYKWTGTLAFHANIVLDAGNDPDAQFNFQIAGTLTVGRTASPIRVTLENGAQAKNVFWAVAETVAIEPLSHFEGNIFAMTDITMKTKSTINGCLFAQSLITLEQNTIVGTCENYLDTVVIPPNQE